MCLPESSRLSLVNINGTRLKDANWHVIESWQDQEKNSGQNFTVLEICFSLIIAVKYINRISGDNFS